MSGAVERHDRAIAFKREYVPATGSINAALMLSQALYWHYRTTQDDKWFYKTQAQWEDETGMTRREQDGARKLLTERGFLKEEKRGVPAKLHYQVQMDAVDAIYVPNRQTECTKPPSLVGGKRQTECTKPPSLVGGKRQTITESTQRVRQRVQQREEQVPLVLNAPAFPTLCVTALPLVGGKFHEIDDAEASEYELAFPAVSLVQELQRIRVWLIANPDRQSKTVKGSRQRVVKWLGREQDKGGRNGTSSGSFGASAVPGHRSNRTRTDGNWQTAQRALEVAERADAELDGDAYRLG